jgi:hypothetical protein
MVCLELCVGVQLENGQDGRLSHPDLVPEGHALFALVAHPLLQLRLVDDLPPVQLDRDPFYSGL